MWQLRLAYSSWLTLYTFEYKAPSPPLPVSPCPHFSLCLISTSPSVLSALASPSLLTLSLPFPSFPPSFLPLFLFFPPPTPPPTKDRELLSHTSCVSSIDWGGVTEQQQGRRPELSAPCPPRLTVSHPFRLPSLTLFLNPDSPPIFF